MLIGIVCYRNCLRLVEDFPFHFHFPFSHTTLFSDDWNTKFYKVLHTALPSTTPYYKVLHSTTPYYKVLHNTTLYYKVLYSTTKYYSVPQSTIQYYSVLQSTTKYCKVPLRTTKYTTIHSVLQSRTAYYKVLMCLIVATYKKRHLHWAEQSLGCKTQWNYHIHVW